MKSADLRKMLSDAVAAGVITEEQIKRAQLRRFAIITLPDLDPKGRPIVYGYGWGWLGEMAKRKRRSVRENISDKGYPLWDPVEAVAWILSRRGHRELADDVLEALGYEARYTVGAP